ncbi:hypothetical protein RUND412_010532 [Rhizina undulata]
MRLHLIPISLRRTLIYGQRLNQITHSKPSLADRAAQKAADTWRKWESGSKGWQKNLTIYGNKLMNQIPYEEWGLKSIPPLSARRERAEIEGKKIQVVYPPSVIDEKNIPSLIGRLATERTSLHRNRMIWSLVGLPIVSPLALVPLVPNIPFFYLLYRAFSHWKALAGAKHLEFLVKNELLQPTPSMPMDAVYRRSKLKAEADKLLKLSEKSEKTEGIKKDELPDHLLITEADAKEIGAAINLSAVVTEIERACRQVAASLKKEAQAKAKDQATDRG